MDAFEILIFALIAGSGLIGEILKKRRNRQNTPIPGSSRPQPGESGYEEAAEGHRYPTAQESEEWSASPSPWEEGFERGSDSGERPGAGRGRGGSVREPAAEDVFDMDRHLEEALFGRREEPAPAPSKPAPSRTAEPVNKGRIGASTASDGAQPGRSRERRPSLERRASLEKGRSLEKERSLESRTLSKRDSRESVRLMGRGRAERTAVLPGGVSELDAPLKVERPGPAAAKSGSSPRAWLATPEKVRQAVIVSEILGRPKSLRRRSDLSGSVRRS